MDDAEKIIELNDEFLKKLSLDERAKALLSLKNFVDRGIVASQKTIVLSAGKSMEAEPAMEIKTDSMVGRAVHDYIITEEIGKGGMGTVYRAFDPKLESYVALKVLYKDDEELVERFMRESKITRQLDHQSFVGVHSIGYISTPSGQKPFYTMPLIRGETLETLVKRRNLPGQEGEKLRSTFTLTRLLLLVQKICEAAQCAHDKNIIHRDLKPSNIMIGPYGEPYIMDLGLGKRLKDPEIDRGSLEARVQHLKRTEEKDLTMDSGLGTPYYMAPEQIFAPQKVDHRTDIFAIGGILYYVLTGQHPHYVLPLELVQYGFTSGTFDDYSFSEVMKECNIIPPSSVIGEKREKLRVAMSLGVNLPMPEPVDRALEAICMKALAKKPEDRYQTYLEMGQELQQFIEGRRELILKRAGKDLTKVMLKKTLPQALEDLKDAEREVREALTMQENLGRMGLEERIVLIDLQIAKARIYDQLGKSDLIIESVEKAMPLIEAPLMEVQRQYIRLRIVGGVANFNDKQYETAKDLQLQAIEMCKSHPDKKLLVSAYHNYSMACMYDFSKRHDEADFKNAKNGFSECYKLADQLGLVSDAVKARAQLANLLLEKTEHREEVKTTLETALKIAAGNESLAAEVHALLSWHYFKQNNYHETITHGELAAALADKTDNQINLNEARLTLGQAYHHLGNAERRIQNLKPVLSYKYAREPLSYEDAVKEFYEKNNLDIKELE